MILLINQSIWQTEQSLVPLPIFMIYNWLNMRSTLFSWNTFEILHSVPITLQFYLMLCPENHLPYWVIYSWDFYIWKSPKISKSSPSPTAKVRTLTLLLKAAFSVDSTPSTALLSVGSPSVMNRITCPCNVEHKHSWLIIRPLVHQTEK